MEAAGLNNTSPDGVSVLPLFKGLPFANRDYFLHFPHYSPQNGKPGGLVISGNYKLIEWYETNTVELYNLSTDPGELTNIAASNTELANGLLAKLNQWRTKMGAKMCTPNPNYVGSSK
jgi:arylsulfatase A